MARRASDPIAELQGSERLRDWIAGAVKRSNGRQSFLSVATELAEGRAQLWVCDGEDGPDGVLLTDLQRYPTGALWLNVRMGAGTMTAMRTAIEVLKEEARQRGCDGIEGVARVGWSRIGKTHGFKETHRFLEWQE